jgi:uncharacterized protein (TIGR00255 family)
MTGFGKANFEDENITIDVEIKSLNSKNFDLRLKNGFLSAENEMEIRQILYQKLTRGKIECFISLELKNIKGKYSINENIFEKYYNQLKKISKNYQNNLVNTDFLSIIMHLPEIMEANDFDINAEWNYIKNTVNEAAEKLVEFRKQEGAATANVLKTYIENIKKYLQKVPDFEMERIDLIRKKIENSFADTNLNIEKERLEAELIYYLEKYDIQEEKNRLSNHLKYFLETLNQENTGKKLGFITQEMGREINTLGSKANHFEIQKLVVMMKDELEKIKEQILNIL